MTRKLLIISLLAMLFHGINAQTFVVVSDRNRILGEAAVNAANVALKTQVSQYDKMLNTKRQILVLQMIKTELDRKVMDEQATGGEELIGLMEGQIKDMRSSIDTLWNRGKKIYVDSVEIARFTKNYFLSARKFSDDNLYRLDAEINALIYNRNSRVKSVYSSIRQKFEAVQDFKKRMARELQYTSECLENCRKAYIGAYVKDYKIREK